MNLILTRTANADDNAVRHSLGGASAGPQRPVVIAGGGPVGIRTAQELSRRGIDCVILNAERWLPYNRVKLTPLLCGEAQLGLVMQPLKFPGPGKVDLYSDQAVIDVDRVEHTVTVKSGRKFAYSKLVFCTGSRAHVPPIPGRDLSGVFTFRNADDVERLVARSFSSRRTIVIGGGLLGLEAARGMASRGAATTVIEHSPHLMPRQLDEAAGAILAREVGRMGLSVVTNASVDSILGSERVEGILLRDGTTIACDSVIVCTGIRANMELARDIGLAVGRGIKVSGQMLTNDPDIYAAGECAEFDGNVYGLVGPGFEQAVAVASDIAGSPQSYRGSVPTTKLKIVGIDVFSMGDVEQIAQRSDVRQISYGGGDTSIYRSLIVERARIVGAIAIGDWPEINRLQEAIRTRAVLYPWQEVRFAWTGRLWREGQPAGVRDWPRTATVCNCTGASRGQIGDAIALGAATLDDVKRDTGASTVCGSCRVHIEALLGSPPVRTPITGWRPAFALSVAAMILALITLAVPRWPIATSIGNVGFAEALWLDGLNKQVSGYVLLALSAAAAALSMRKRVGWLSFGSFAGWRIVHIAIGLAALVGLFAHTGLRLGTNLNLWLVASFLSLALAGALAGATTALEHRLFAAQDPAQRARRASFWIHLFASWPLPLLLAMHILTVYYF